MPIIINQVKCPLEMTKDEIICKALKTAKIPRHSIKEAELHKTSLDARHQNNIFFVHSVFVILKDKEEEKRISARNSNINYVENSSISPIISNIKKQGRIVITGFGPAGIFCSLILAENGYRPVVLEKGQEVDKRIKSVNDFWNNGILNEKSNVQFGEGGAGTFSDGKLTTRIKDPICRYVLERFVEFGAPKEILTKAKPHIGTDKLRNVIKNIREHIISCGGEIHFETELNDFTIENDNVKAAECSYGTIPCSALVLAIGHSARNTFKMLADKNIFLEPKAFSVGVRIEHSQQAVNESLYGKNADNPLLPVGEYQLSYRDKSGHAVYTFCMCPGGVVVPAASECGGIVTNGMSEFSRNGDNANSAMVVSVSPKDFGNHALDGIKFARSIEQKAYQSTHNYTAPATTVNGFLNKSPNLNSNIKPTYALGLIPVELRDIFPTFVTDMLEMGLDKFSQKMRCFNDKNAILTGPETRTSSPVRITRGEMLNSISVQNLYPCGEGAGYAGGIMSAAVDGIKVALKIMENQAP